MSTRLPLLLACLLAFPASSGHAQAARPVAAQAPGFTAWKPSAAPAAFAALAATPSRRHREGNALLGAAIGTVAGLAFCTAISNLTTDPAAGFSTCTTKGYLITGAAGFALGFAIGWHL